MSNQPKIPDTETRARSVARLRSLVERMDKNITQLDEFIACLEAENHRSFEAAKQKGNARQKAAQILENS